MNLVKRNGLKVTVEICCSNCGANDEYTNSATFSSDQGGKKIFDINLRLVYGLRAVGLGREGARMFCGIMNIPPPPSRFQHYIAILLEAIKQVAQSSMDDALNEAITINNDSKDLCVTFDGTWQKRGHSSMNGVVSASCFDTGKIVDIEVMSRHCLCESKLTENHNDDCKANYYGSSGGMEVFGAKKIFERSVEKQTRYEYYLGDGDSKAFLEVANSKPYGEDFEIKKLECVGHIQKRMGSRLRKLKKSLGKEKLEDGKTIGGRGRLTDSAIIQIQNYFGLAIRRNSSDIETMKKDVWAEFFHLLSSDELPNHSLCPKGVDSWCKYQKSVAENKEYKHKDHFHLPVAVMLATKPIFRDLAHPDLLSKCLHGKTQNLNESYNNVLWSIIPKRIFVSLETLSVGAYEAVASFNMGQISKCKVLKALGVNVGQECIKAMKAIDKHRILVAARKFRIDTKEARLERSKAVRKLEESYEEAEGFPYEAGGH